MSCIPGKETARNILRVAPRTKLGSTAPALFKQMSAGEAQETGSSKRLCWGRQVNSSLNSYLRHWIPMMGGRLLPLGSVLKSKGFEVIPTLILVSAYQL